MKRILAVLLCLLLCPAALAEVYVVDSYGSDEAEGYSMLLADDGMPLTPPRTYSSIYRITPDGVPEAERLYSVAPIDLGLEYDPATAEDMRYEMGYTRVALMDAQGRLLTGFDYEGLDYNNGYVTFTLPGERSLAGAMDPSGHVVMEPEYAELKHLAEDRWLAMAIPEDESAVRRVYYDDGGYYEEIDYEIVLIDSDGSRKNLGLHTRDRYFQVNPEGICVVWNVDEYDNDAVFIDSYGEVMFDRGFRTAENFDGDYAVAAEGDRYGLIGKDGAYAIQPEYEYIQSGAGKPYIATDGRTVVVYDRKSLDVMAFLEFENASEVNVTAITGDLLGVSVGEGDEIYDMTGELLVRFSEDDNVILYGYSGDGVNRLLAYSGTWPEEYYRLVDLEGRAASGGYRMLNNGTWRDGHGRFITGDYRVLTDSDGEFTVDWSTYRYGLIDEEGETLLPMVYDDLRALDYDRYWAVVGDRSGMIDGAGKWYYTVSDYETLMD